MEKNCKKIEPLIAQMLDGILEEEAAQKVRSHLSDCPACAAAARQMLATVRLIKGLPEGELSQGFDAALRARIDAAEKSRVGALGASLRWAWPIGPLRGRMALAPLSLSLASLVLFGLLAVHTRLLHHPPAGSPAAGLAGNGLHDRSLSDRALLDACLRQHRSYIAGDPLADSSAQTLAGQIDASTDRAPGNGSSGAAGSETL